MHQRTVEIIHSLKRYVETPEALRLWDGDLSEVHTGRERREGSRSAGRRREKMREARDAEERRIRAYGWTLMDVILPDASKYERDASKERAVSEM